MAARISQNQSRHDDSHGESQHSPPNLYSTHIPPSQHPSPSHNSQQSTHTPPPRHRTFPPPTTSSPSHPGHPFSDNIMAVRLPTSFRLPTTMDHYDGSSDPQEHLDVFNSAMLLSGDSDEIRCRAFPSTLRKAALQWFSSLPPRSVDNFAELRDRFLAQFSTSRAYRKTTTSLINFRQGPNETLKEFMGRFNNMAIQIRDLNPAVSMHAILAGLRDGPFADSLTRRPPADLDELRARAMGYVNVEEAAAARRQTTRVETETRPV